jgi:phage terminase large subunit-like protein
MVRIFMSLSLLQAPKDQVKLEMLKGFMFYKPTPKQAEFHAASLHAKERLFLGGNRTGKTNAVCMEMAMHLTGIYPVWWKGYRFSRPINAISASISLKDTRDILQKKLFVGDIDASMPPIVHESYIIEKLHTNIAGAWDTVRIRHVSGGISELKFKAFQQGESSFQGVKADFIHLDELPNFKVYQEALIRTTSFDHEKTFLVASLWPERGKDDLLSHFMDYAPEGEVRDGRFYIMASWADNPYLKEEEREHLRKSVPAWQLEAREHGIPVFGQGKVFTMKESELFVEPFQIPKHFALVYGLDPSASSGGTWGCVLLAHDRDRDIVYAVADYKLSNATPTEHASNILRIVPDWCTGMVDPAGAGENMHTKEKTLDFLQARSGLRLVKANKANNAKEATIDEIYERVRGDRFKIFYTDKGLGCRHLVNEWRQYARDDNGLILKKNDHCLDAAFYALNGLAQARTETQFHQERVPRWGEAGYL